MSAKSIRSRVHRWITDGPDNEDNSLEWFIGNILWWRIWGFTGIVFGGIYILNYLNITTSSDDLWVIGYLIGVLTGVLILKVSPKFEVTRNY